MNDKKPLFIPNKFRKLVQQNNSQIASQYTPEYNRLFDEGKIDKHVEDLPSNSVIKEKLKKDFDANKSNTNQNSIPRIGANQDLYWNQAIANPSKGGYYDEEIMDQPVYDESLDMVENSDLKDAIKSVNKPQDIKAQRMAALELQAAAQQAAQAVAKAEFEAAQRAVYTERNKRQTEPKKASPKQEMQSSQEDSVLDIVSIAEGNLILINSKTSELLMVSEDLDKISSKIEDLLQEDSSLEDFVVLHKLKINVGVTLK